MNFSHYLEHTLFFSMEVLSLRNTFFYKFGLIIFLYFLNLLKLTVIFQCRYLNVIKKIYLLHNDLVLNYPK